MEFFERIFKIKEIEEMKCKNVFLKTLFRNCLPEEVSRQSENEQQNRSHLSIKAIYGVAVYLLLSGRFGALCIFIY